MKLPEQLPSDPDEIERLYNEYALDVEDFDDAEFQRMMDARLAVWGIDPKQMTPDQIFGAMAESMNSMLLSLYAAMDDAPDDLASEQVGRDHQDGRRTAPTDRFGHARAIEKSPDESQPDVSA